MKYFFVGDNLFLNFYFFVLFYVLEIILEINLIIEILNNIFWNLRFVKNIVLSDLFLILFGVWICVEILIFVFG